ncbi:Ankyrin repeat-containing protein [Pseudozyma hubeiensis]|nr:Ankyrin repeat-containing protein [Pseudozyma hubeiensis]
MSDHQENDDAVHQIDVQNKRLLHAARTDDLDLLQEIISSGAFDANHSDGVGRNALHYAAAQQSTQVLPEILNLEIDVDYQDRTNADTPLHAAVNVDIPDGEAGKEVEEIRNWIVNELLEAGADPTIPNKDGDLPADLLSYGTKSRSQSGQDLVARLKRGQAEMQISAGDIANDDDVADDGEGSEGTPSEE